MRIILYNKIYVIKNHVFNIQIPVANAILQIS